MFDLDLSDPHLLFSRQAGCVTCPDPAPCSCASNQVCERTVQTCTTCAANFCVANPNASTGKTGVSNGALAGAVLGCIFLLTLVTTAFFLWRRRARAKKAAMLALEKNSISPYDLQGPSVLSTPLGHSPHSAHFPPPGSPHSQTPPRSPIGDVRIYNNSVINLDPSAATPGSPQVLIHNPFSDAASMSTMGTNVIPIAYMPPNSASMSLADGMQGRPMSSGPLPPSRPARSPDLHLRLPPNAVSRASLVDAATSAGGNDLLAPRSPYAAKSTKSELSVASSRASTMTSASSLYERPVIVTSAKVGRQVLGVTKAEVVLVPNSAPGSPRSPGAMGLRARAPSVRSPLAGPSFNQEDIELRKSPTPPPLPGQGPGSPSMSIRSNPFSDLKSANAGQDAFLRTPVSPTHQPLPDSRPGSTLSPTSPNTPISASTIRGPEGRLLTPSRGDFPPMPPAPPEHLSNKHFPRESTSSFVSATSRADSIMNNGFVFFPPTPGSNQSQFSGTFGPRGGQDVPPEDMSPVRGKPGRQTLGFSTYSTSSNMSSGLEAFPFQFGGGDSPTGVPENSRNAGVPAVPQSMSMSTLAGAGLPRDSNPPNVPHAGMRASLDTLALSRDVEAYPLAYDRMPR